MENVNRTYPPAAGHDWALPLYDPFVKLLGGAKARQALIVQAALPMVGRVLDVGCGTGSLAVLLKQLHPQVHGICCKPRTGDLVGWFGDEKAASVVPGAACRGCDHSSVRALVFNATRSATAIWKKSWLSAALRWTASRSGAGCSATPLF